MIFESKAPRARIMDHGRAVQFRPSNETQANGERFGYFDTTGSDVMLAGFKDAAECEQFLRGSHSFKRGAIWPRENRLDRERGAKEGAARDAYIDNLTEGQLRGYITGSNIACPGEGAAIDHLRQIARAIASGQLKPGDEVPAAPTPEDQPPDKPESGKSGKSGKKK